MGKTVRDLAYQLCKVLKFYMIITLKDALRRAREAAIPDIPPPITITEGDEQYWLSI